ncbi:hypothetical protein PpBr36_02529, partial [Pyricularia pennisetigena]|uniref:hypothetical protein n=1 Tax=Pyricularia pennisetigena TaxID=1578925 RepID=UPI0011533294
LQSKLISIPTYLPTSRSAFPTFLDGTFNQVFDLSFSPTITMKFLTIITLAVSAVAAQTCVLKCSSGPQGGNDVTTTCSSQGVTCTTQQGLQCKLGFPSFTPPAQCTFCSCAPPSGV